MSPATATLDRLTRAADAGLLRELDLHLAHLLTHMDGTEGAELPLAAALASRQVGDGHVCLDLAAVAGTRLFEEETETALTTPPLAAWRDALAASTVVGGPGDAAPLILDGDRLYLGRYWRFEYDLATALQQRTARSNTDLDHARLAVGLARLYGPPGPGEPDWQRLAAALALLRPFCVISGGPGTGKTYTVTAILALLAEQAAPALPRVALAAPTGKAAARLVDSIRKAKAGLALDPAIQAAIPEQAATLHRLLGITPGSARPRYHAGNPLHLDVLVVDEASMVDLPLMARLLAALPAGARLILLGDRDQLASVEAGAVLGDICAGAGAWSAATCAALAAVSGSELKPAERVPAIADTIALLRQSRRFDANSGIGRLARAVNDGDAPAATALLAAGAHDLAWAEPPPARLGAALAEVAMPAWRAYLKAPDPAAALAAFDRFRILCAVRHGPFGVNDLNALAEQVLAHADLVRPTVGAYAGQPLMVTRNDYNLRLFNGDIGLVLPDPAADGALRAFFPDPEGGLRRLHPARLPEHESVYAMTVHKSQGSEMDHVLLVLPEPGSPVLTRELVYTGITRARHRLTLWGSAASLRAAVGRRVERSSGLRERLWADGGPTE